MATFIANHLWRVTQVVTGVAGSPYYITGYFDAVAGTAQQAADAWRNLLGTTSTIYRSGLSFSAISTIDEFDPTTGNIVGQVPVTVASLAFIGGTDALPAATSLLLRWRTGQYAGGKEVRGRTNIPGLPSSANALGLPSSAITSAFQTRQTALLALANAHHVVYSPKNAGACVTTSGTPWGQWAVLRSRRD